MKTISPSTRLKVAIDFWQRISRILLVAFPGLVAIALVVGGIVS